MTNHSLPTCMVLPLRDFSVTNTNTEFAKDLGPCHVCSGCRPDITSMITSEKTAACLMCNGKGPLKCSRCHDAEYCSADCQHADWRLHKLVCKKVGDFPSTSRPSQKHFRVIVFPYQAGTLSSRSYGPLIAFAYNLDSEFKYSRMDDMSTADFRHLVDFFRNSDWNPTIGDADRYPEKAISGLLLPDPLIPAPEDSRRLSICHIIRTHEPVMSVNIATTINFKQTCWHVTCNPETSPIKQLCSGGSMWHAFLLGPLLLGLPWIGRNVMVTDVHDKGARRKWPLNRWKQTYSRFLCQSVRVGYRCLTIDVLRKSDGIIVFNAFGTKINPLHMLAYDELMYRQLQTHESERNCSKENFLGLWTDLQEGKTKILHQKPKHQNLDFTKEASPYNNTNTAKPILTDDVSQAFLYLRELFQNREFRALTHQYEVKEMFEEAPRPDRWTIKKGFWRDDLESLFPRAGNSPLAKGEEETNRKSSEQASQEVYETGYDLSELASMSLDMIKE
ncbi:hypothetical protein F66182_7761 [Fusarium sp. NRRL 66182]|nr:hypothetical protein F66182_7761 [Fusarium sp. NRRL 66182]